MSNSFWPHGLRHARLACSSPAPGVCSNACLLSWWCHSTISSLYFPCSPTFKFSQYQGLFQWFSLCIRWPKYWSFSSSISPSNEHSRLISFRMDWLDLLAVQGTLKSLLQHYSSKASILKYSAFFMVQFSHSYMTTEKIIALTRPLSAKWCLCFLICCLGWL